MIGLTTNNPYHSVNPAVRSRTHVLKLKPISNADILKRLHQVEEEFKDELSATLEQNVYDYIAISSNNEIRTAINQLEILSMISQFLVPLFKHIFLLWVIPRYSISP